jgi:NAD(P)-dependent dehydrogenase (short-subunit alcohol dehydrogenase family)
MGTTKDSIFDLTGRTALITGAGGILGAGFARILAAHGASVVLVDISGQAAQAAADAILAQLPQARVLPLQIDITRPEAVATMIETANAAFGAVHILLNNAAGKSSNVRAFFEPLETFSLDTWREVMAVNVDAAFLVAQAVGSDMKRKGIKGSIVQTASIYGVVGPDARIYEGSNYLGGPINTPLVYAASKGAIIAMTRYLATYWGADGIRVNSLTPGGIESGQNEAFTMRYSHKVPLGRMGSRDELQGAVLFLASDASSYVTGHNLVVDGGFTAW